VVRGGADALRTWWLRGRAGWVASCCRQCGRGLVGGGCAAPLPALWPVACLCVV